MDTQENLAMVADSQPSLQKRAVKMPMPGDGQVLVRISHVAQNPTDVKSFDTKAFGDGAVFGCDFVGEVVQLGKGVTRLSKDNVVAALIWGGEIPGLGAYSQFTLADEKICFKIPPGISRAQAATVPLAASTAWLALFSSQCLNMDRSKGQSILIWGGSSSVGQYAIQLSSIYGFNVITTCSRKNFDLVKRMGAIHVFDYNSPDIIEQIRSVSDIKFIFDTIGNATSSEAASQAAQDNSTICTVRPGKANTEGVRDSVKVTDVLVWTAFFKDHTYGQFKWPASVEDNNLAAELFTKLPEWLKVGKVIPNNVLALHGLEALNEGFDLHRQGKISAAKVVYEI